MWEAMSVKRVANFLQKPWILTLAKSVETFIHVSINDMPTIKYWQNLGWNMEKAKEMIPK